ncbi:MAG TPA: PaaI family thioesterase [Mycobacteriales bacterium]|jgi:uncharacterized protein (TIGR00369 family)|nr:PaaI family thioesterase [Mycobacteriales bacterium]
MTVPAVDLALLRHINETAAFNQWAGFEVTQAEPGRVELRLPWRAEFGQYAGFLHAGLVSALIDTACGFAAATVVGGQVLASHCAVSFLAPARGEVFVARGHVVKAGRRQVFTAADLSAEADGARTLVASGQTILVPTGGQR